MFAAFGENVLSNWCSADGGPGEVTMQYDDRVREQLMAMQVAREQREGMKGAAVGCM